ncbi:MAG: ASKHA domain-containing protein [Eubacteriales bacterium]|nr:ASKHA domain-containing protein [Eubacteriales bacterium]
MQEENRTVLLEAAPAESLLEALKRKNIFMEGGCNGAGRCGRCLVRFVKAAPLPTAQERRFLTAMQLREGWRLACLHRCAREYEVEVGFSEAPKIQVVTETAAGAERASGRGAVQESAWCVAVDLGTTTIAMQARELESGAVLGEWVCMNPQRREGSDVISRMQAAMAGRARELSDCVCRALEQGLESLRGQVAATGRYAPEPEGSFLAGNTVMEHLLLGLPVEGLSRYPFRPETLEEGQLCLKNGRVTLLPGFSAFVGADLLAGVLATGLDRSAEPQLLVDLGTNGEMVLGCRDWLLCTATAAGPAFEGGPGNQAPGTDLIAAIAALLREGRMDETGLLAEPWFQTGADCRAKDAVIHIDQADIRAVQMAKAAVYAGIRVLLQKAGLAPEQVERVWLAGGFGYFLDVKSAVEIGLFPEGLTGRIRAVGNTSLQGAWDYGRLSIKDGPETVRQRAEAMKARCRAINLAEEADFEEIYLEHIDL